MPTVRELLNEAWALREQAELARAEQIYRLIVGQFPESASTWFLLGIVLNDQRRHREAIQAYREALCIRPEYPAAWNNLGNAYWCLCEVEQAEACYAIALRLKPDYALALKNRGMLLAGGGDFQRAFDCYQAGLRVTPDDPELHRNLGLLYLRHGDFARGWPEYAWRWRCPDLHRPPFTQSVWNGQPVHGKTILIYAEQGLGDTIHFIRLVERVKARGARTLVVVQPALLPLLKTCRGIDRWLPALESVEEHFDYHCSLIDLASVFVEIASDIQAGGPYITPNPGLVEYWRHWAEQRFTSGKRRVGIVWQGNPRQPVDHFRSCPLAALEPLTRVESVQLLSLQIGMGNDQLTDWAQRNKILVVPPEFDNASGAFMDSAALLAHLDLLISVDTAILHVAGALGRPVWLLLGSAPDWRWMIQRSDSPWYSTLRLFRQTRPGAWDTVVGRVVAALDGGPSGCEKSYSFAG